MNTNLDETELGGVRLAPQHDDEGKNIIDADGRDLGMVTTVVGNTMYADPNTALSAAVERELGWGGNRSTDLPVPADLITRIDDEVVLAVEREEHRGQEIG